jgi:hypothetical protein
MNTLVNEKRLQSFTTDDLTVVPNGRHENLVNQGGDDVPWLGGMFGSREQLNGVDQEDVPLVAVDGAPKDHRDRSRRASSVQGRSRQTSTTAADNEVVECHILPSWF